MQPIRAMRQAPCNIARALEMAYLTNPAQNAMSRALALRQRHL